MEPPSVLWSDRDLSSPAGLPPCAQAHHILWPQNLLSVEGLFICWENKSLPEPISPLECFSEGAEFLVLTSSSPDLFPQNISSAQMLRAKVCLCKLVKEFLTAVILLLVDK